ncbi:enterochelin esterase domain-containing protein [Tatumella ptyseos]|uniref:enterochelin esterase domain-containing protein n=1 Tax=Tatumella ptyseos TaxID=82987 RepID=UPI0030CCEA22
MVTPEWLISPGTDFWWQQQQQRGLPLIERLENALCRVTFLWRDPQGSEKTSAFRHVWINITGITDHHQPAPPAPYSGSPAAMSGTGRPNSRPTGAAAIA